MVLLSHSWPLTVAVIVLTSCQSQYRDVNYLSTARLDLLLSQTSGELHVWKKVSTKSKISELSEKKIPTEEKSHIRHIFRNY